MNRPFSHSSKVLIFLTLLIFSMSISAKAEEWDAGYSHNFFLKQKLGEKWAFESRSLFTSKNEMSDINFAVADAGLSYKMTDWLSLGAAYRGAWSRGSESWSYENRPLINISLAKNLAGYYLSNRVRFEFRDFEGERESDIRLRNEVRLIMPQKITPLGLRPYIEEELFYSFDKEMMQMHWLSGGLMYQVNENMRIKMGYRWKTVRVGDRWINSHVLVTGFLFFY